MEIYCLVGVYMQDIGIIISNQESYSMSSQIQFSDKMLGMHVGQKVKSLRRKLSITRRQLAEKSSISERYIGQLENGQANVSLNVLNRIVVELGAQITDVLPEVEHKLAHKPLSRLLGSLERDQLEQVYQTVSKTFTSPKLPSKGIALVGMRGAGKSSLGSKLSKLCDIKFVRLTHVIAENAGMTVGELIELRGEKGFRRIEREVLEDLVAAPGRIILETSGGLVGSPESYALVREHFTTIWVKATPEEHMQRVIDQNDLRPMSGRSSAMADLKSLLAEREPAYALADFKLNTSNRSERDCLGELTEITVPALSRQPIPNEAAE